jgi:hypothetical protein
MEAKRMTGIATRYQARTKREMREDLEEALVTDQEAVAKIREHLRGILEICGSMNVDPETLLFEVDMFRASTQEMIHELSLIRMKQDPEEAPLSPLQATRVFQESERLFRMIEETATKAHRASLRKGFSEYQPEPADRPSQDGPSSGPRSNEEQEYVPSNDRPNYIA